MSSSPMRNTRSLPSSAPSVSSYARGRNTDVQGATGSQAPLSNLGPSGEGQAVAWRVRPVPLLNTPPPFSLVAPDAPQRRDRIFWPYFPTPPSPTDLALMHQGRATKTASEREEEGYIADASSSEYSEESREAPARVEPRRLSFEGKLPATSTRQLRSHGKASSKARDFDATNKRHDQHIRDARVPHGRERHL